MDYKKVVSWHFVHFWLSSVSQPTVLRVMENKVHGRRTHQKPPWINRRMIWYKNSKIGVGYAWIATENQVRTITNERWLLESYAAWRFCFWLQYQGGLPYSLLYCCGSDRPRCCPRLWPQWTRLNGCMYLAKMKFFIELLPIQTTVYHGAVKLFFPLKTLSAIKTNLLKQNHFHHRRPPPHKTEILESNKEKAI